VSWLVPVCLAGGCLAFALAVSGCESTQAKSDRLAKEGASSVKQQKGLEITRKSKTVKVLDTALVTDANGAAAVAVVRNGSKAPLGNVPLAIDVLDAKGKAVFRNDDPGLEPSLAGVASLAPGQTLAWVNDQILPTGGKPKSVEAVAGADKGALKGGLPKIEVGKAHLGGDPTSGVAAEGTIVNRSRGDQRQLVLFAVARRGGQIVAAGRGQVDRLRAGKKAQYQIFFIGNPKGGQIEVSAPAIVKG
jgi:hypothetical protein